MKFRATCPLCRPTKSDIEVLFGNPRQATDIARRTAEIFCKGCGHRFHVEAIAEFFPAECQGFSLDDVQGKA